MRFVGRGHSHIRATHAKTLELTVDTDITERATCVVAVGAHPSPPAPLAGRVRITIAARGEAFELYALANSSWDPSGPAVIRRSPLRLPGTLATHASAASSDLPRSLVEALRSPDAVVEVSIEAEPPTRETVVLFWADPARNTDDRLRAEVHVADAVHAEDAGARRLVADWSARSARRPRRSLVVATDDLPGRSAPVDLAASVIETVGLPARLAVAAASPSRGPLVLAPDTADPRELLRTTPADHRLVLMSDLARLPALLALATEIRGRSDAVVAQEHGAPLRVVGDELPELSSRDVVFCCFDAAGPAAVALDPAVLAAITHLLDDGVPKRSIARVLADLTGLPRREAYDAIVQMNVERS